MALSKEWFNMERNDKGLLWKVQCFKENLCEVTKVKQILSF